MISTVINSLRVFKDLYDLVFSDETFYADSRAELKNGVGYSIEQFREGYNNPRPASEKARARWPKPVRVTLWILFIARFLALMIGGQR
jgi:hypothetical protein